MIREVNSIKIDSSFYLTFYGKSQIKSSQVLSCVLSFCEKDHQLVCRQTQKKINKKTKIEKMQV